MTVPNGSGHKELIDINSAPVGKGRRRSRRASGALKFAILFAASLIGGYLVGAYQLKAQLGDSTSPPPLLSSYAFELNSSGARLGEQRIDLRLVDTQTRRNIPSAVIYASRLDMAPDGMPTMTAPLIVEPMLEAGIYRFVTNYPMEGSWRLSLAAKIPGSEGTVSNQVTIVVAP